MYQQIKYINALGIANCILRISDNSFIPFDPSNADYQAFKAAIKIGKNPDGSDVLLNNPDGIAMTYEQIQTFLATLP